MKLKRKKWQDYEITMLEKLLGQGKKDAEIAEILGRSYDSVVDKKRKLGLNNRQRLSWKDPKMLAQIVKFRLAGWSVAEIAKIFKVNQSNISKLLKYNGLKRKLPFVYRKRKPSVKWSEFDNYYLRKCCIKQMPFEQICSLFPDRTPTALKKRIEIITRYWLPESYHNEVREMRSKQLRVW